MNHINRYNLKYLLTISLFIIAITNGQARQYFRIIEATSMKWSGGVRLGPSGITYRVKAIILTKRRVDFRDLLIGNERISVEKASNADIVNVKHFKGDTIIIVYTLNHWPLSSQPQIPITSANGCSASKNSGSMFCYTVGKATKYEPIEFKALTPQNRQ